MIHKNTGPGQFSNFMSLKPAKSVSGPVVMNDDVMWCLLQKIVGNTIL